MRVNTNVNSLDAQRTLNATNIAVSRSMQKLSSGFRINRAADDAAGLGIANKLRADTRSMTQASRNAEQANSLLQIAEGSTSSVQNILERMKELATQAASDSVDDSGRTKIQAEFEQLRSEIGRIVDTTKFQGKKLLDASFGNSVVEASSTVLTAGTTFQDVNISGAASGLYTLTNNAAGKLVLTNGTTTETATQTADGKQTVNFSSFGLSVETTAAYDKDATTASQGGAAGGLTVSVAAGSGGGSFLVSSSGDYTGQDLISLETIDLRTSAAALNIDASTLTGTTTAQAALTVIDTAMARVSTALGTIGAAQNRIEYALTNLKTSIQNFSAAESVIRDVDMAEEMARFSKNQILAQAGTAMLAQANQSAQGVLQLLRS